MEICLNQIHDLTHTTLVPCHAWAHWLLMHACYAANQISPHHLFMHIECFACDKCQCTTPSGSSHGLLLDWDIAGVPWEEVAVDLIEPWITSTPHDIVKFFALTSIDTMTNFLKIAKIFEKSIDHVATCFEHTRLSWYP